MDVRTDEPRLDAFEILRSKLPDIAGWSADQVLGFSLDQTRYLDTAEDKAWIEAGIREWGQNGKNIVFIGGKSPLHNVIFHHLGMTHRQEGNMTNIFFMSVEAYLAAMSSAPKLTERTAVQDTRSAAQKLA